MNPDQEVRVAYGLRQCLSVEHERGALCREPAVWHVRMTATGTTMVCAGGADDWGDRTYVDMHLIGPACGLPSSRWRPATRARPGSCFVPGFEHLNPAPRRNGARR